MEGATSIGKRIKKFGYFPKSSPSKKKVGSTQLACFHGIARQRIRTVRRVLSALKVNTKEGKTFPPLGVGVAILMLSTFASP